MANETLRLKAELEDQFTGPMRRLRGELLAFQREGSRQMQDVSKVVGAVEGAFHSTARTATSVLNPAMMALGVTGLSAGAALAGITGALNKLSSNLSGIGQLSRDTGIAAKTLQEFNGVASRFNLTQDQVASGAQAFADKMRVFSRGQGELWKWTLSQGTNAESRSAFQSFADDLARTADQGEQLKKALNFGETIKDPRGQRIFFQEFFGNADLSRIAQGQLGKVADLFAQFRAKAGPFDPAAVKQAEDYERAINDLKGSMQSIGTTIAREVLPYVSGLAHYLDEAVKGERGPAIVAIREAFAGIGTELAKVNWETAGKEAGAAFKAILDSLKPLTESLTKTVELIQALRSGSVTDVLRVTTGGQGTLGAIIRNVAPKAGDDEIGARAEVEALKKELKAAEYDQETGGPALDFKSREPVLKKRLDDAERELARLQARSPAQRDAEFSAAMDKQRKATEENTEALKKRVGEATVQQQSFDATGTGGARFQTASLTNGGFRRPGIFGGGSGPGYVGEQGEAGSGTYGPGRFNPQGIPRGGRSGPMFSPDSPQGRAARSLRGGVSDDGPRIAGQGAVPNGIDGRAQRAMARLIARGWTPEAAASAVGQAVEESSVRSDGPLGDTRRFGTGDEAAHGMFQWRGSRYRALKQFAEKRGVPWTDFDAQVDFFDQERKGRSRDERDWHLETDLGRGNRIGKKFEGYDGGLQPQRERHARRQLELYRRGGTSIPKPEIMVPPEHADGEGWAARERARKAYEAGSPDVPTFQSALKATRDRADADARQLAVNSARMTDAAGRAGVMGGNVNGSVTTVIEKAGPDARARTVTKGNLFQTIRTVNGRQMRRPDD